MKKFLALFVTLVALTATAARADFYPQPFPPPPGPIPVQLRGTFCSAATADGNWAFTFSGYDVFTNCNQVQQALYWATRAPISGTFRGYYNMNGFNSVVVQCAFAQQFFNGIGAFPLQTAFNWANAVHARSCIFRVN